MNVKRILVLGLLAAALGGCAGPPRTPPAGVRVLAAETFLAEIAQHVAGDRLVVESLLAPGIDPHEFQAAPQDAVRITEADVLIVNGRGYEAWLEKSLDAAEGDRVVVEASAGLPAGPGGDPHLWMNPRNVVRYLENIRDGLARADPEGSSLFATNAENYIHEIRALDEWIQGQVDGLPASRRVLVTNHHALESFAEAYGFEVAGVIVPSTTSGAAPSARQLADLIQTIEALQTPAIFLDSSENPDLARQIASETGVQVITGLYIETLSGPDGPAPTYLGMMKHDVQLIVEALR
jgi:ABC-type Zn uptake system ZnuABC Zn-binding protein ZnuA